jgi:hypothetical protein
MIEISVIKQTRSLERPKRRWEDNIRMDLREIRWGDMDSMHVAQNRDQRRAVVNTVMSFRVPLKAENFLTS